MQQGITTQKPQGRSRRNFLTRDLGAGILGLIVAGTLGTALLNALTDGRGRMFRGGPGPEPHPPYQEKTSSITWSQDGTMVAISNVDGSIQIMSVTSNSLEPVTTLNQSGYNGVAAWSPDNSRLALANLDNSVNIYLFGQSQSGQPWKIFNGSYDVVADMAWSPDSKYIATVGQYEALRVIDAMYGSIVFTGDTTVFSDTRSVSWSPDSKHIVTSGNVAFSSSPMQVWDVAQHKPLFSFGTTTPHLIAWSPDGKYIASLDENTTITVWNASNGSFYSSLNALFAPPLAQLIWSPDSKNLALSTIRQPLLVLNVSSHKQLIFDLPLANMHAIAWLSNTQIITIDDNQYIQIIAVGGTQS